MWELQEKIAQMVDQYFEDSSAVRVSAEEIGLDSRAGYVFVSVEEGWIAVNSAYKRSLDYYGGFEYVDYNHREEILDFTFFASGCSRVDDALEHYNEKQEKEDEMFISRRQALISEDDTD
jgi:hypothetical protein